MRKMIAAAVLMTVAATPNAAAIAASEAKPHEALTGHILVDRLEYRLQDGDDHVAWEADAWYGGDYEKIWLKTKGEHGGGRVEEAETQLLYTRLIGHFWDLQAGLRYDFRPDPSRGHAVIGLQGLAPGFIEVEAQGFLSDDGDLSARLEAEYDLPITQQLVLQASGEAELAVQEVAELGIGSGVNAVELGLRLRYEIVREFAPYVGLQWQRKIGETARLAERAGDDVEETAVLLGLRFWF